MRAAYYFDITVQRELALRGPSGTAISVMAKALTALHGIGLNRSIEFASAYPLMKSEELPHPGAVLRVFVSAREDAEAFADQLESNVLLMGYLHLGRVKAAPVFTETTVEYRLFKVPSLRSYGKARPGAWSIESRATPGQRRLEMIRRGDSMPYLMVSSSSNQHAFSIRIERTVGTEVISTDFKPNSYGLGSRTNRILLPNILEDRARDYSQE